MRVINLEEENVFSNVAVWLHLKGREFITRVLYNLWGKISSDGSIADDKAAAETFNSMGWLKEEMYSTEPDGKPSGETKLECWGTLITLLRLKSVSTMRGAHNPNSNPGLIYYYFHEWHALLCFYGWRKKPKSAT